ncbi:MAG: polyamine aminopropyltransferase [Salinarimonadaceae bacterium]|nr:MAG: polyamine aminopropyltransferase [Salinarimonadaceae bacterium]
MLNYTEALHDGYAQSFRVDRLVHYEKTAHQELAIFDNASFGRVLALDGVIQLTERDHHVYHEMIVHTPVFGHGEVRDVLIVGGGDGGALREALRHPDIRVTVVEIDAQVVETARRHLSMICGAAFDDPRVQIVIDDGTAFVARTDRSFDVILIDSTDPVGPAKALFSPEFYAACRRRLRPGGALVTQNGVPLFQGEQLRASMIALRRIFRYATCYLAAVPTYTGGPIALGFATDDPGRLGEPEALAARVAASRLEFRYYSAAVHLGAFALPPAVLRLLEP